MLACQWHQSGRHRWRNCCRYGKLCSHSDVASVNIRPWFNRGCSYAVGHKQSTYRAWASARAYGNLDVGRLKRCTIKLLGDARGPTSERMPSVYATYHSNLRLHNAWYYRSKMFNIYSKKAIIIINHQLVRYLDSATPC